MNIKTDCLNKSLQLALQIMRARAASYRKAWQAALPEDSHSGPTDNYTAMCIYDACAGMLAEALDGNYENLTQFVADDPLPEIPEYPCDYCSGISAGCRDAKTPAANDCTRCWVDWNEAMRIREARQTHDEPCDAASPEPSDPTCPCDTCTFKYCPDGRTTGGKLDCAVYAEWSCKAGNK